MQQYDKTLAKIIIYYFQDLDNTVENFKIIKIKYLEQ